MLHYIKCNVRSDVTFYAADPRRGFFYVITAEYLSVAAFDIFWSFGQLCERETGYSPSHFSSTSEAGLNVRLLRRPMHLVPADTDENKST